ncbi:PQQ-dependent sugar dehydrogenase [Cesiribacter andamanensis]|uniref:Soluble aldose sugar dehydrogenase yliI n=1 Tax=Cesiribacter andamanensis AMV16 TaxID=1279009 RepID=M7N3P7_9BACT|nr:PQQ-dependent sugar dehydrogenase [Cesiribacter andamanensis]EMR03283.1 Soluble aldose sugar dehydrogenase yliI precursor [Cesiribacter andamanensis AMV16]
MTNVFFLLPLWLGALFFSGCNSGGTGTPDTGNDQLASTVSTEEEERLQDLGRKKAIANFGTYCSGCHGDNATTFADRKWRWGESADAIFASIKEGHPDAGMPGFAQTFSDEEIKQLVGYIRDGMQQVAQYSFSETPQSLEGTTLQTETLKLRLEEVASDFGQVPWGMAFLPDGGMLITEIGGALYRLSPEGRLEKVSGAPQVLAQGQGGLLDVVLHPNFNQNQLVYLSYSAQKREGGETKSTTAIMRARLEGTALKQPQTIFEAQPWETTRHHYGSRMAFGPDGLLYFSVGDRGRHQERYPQDLAKHPGKIHRIRDDGSIPPDNPFAGRSGAQASIYSYGHRNPQGLAFHPQTGELWSHEHGPRGGDEINRVQAGANYGWPAISYGINYDGTILTDKTEQEGMLQPLKQWTPSIAPSGMAFVTGNRYKGWEGNLLSGSLRYKYLNRSRLQGATVAGEEQLLKNLGRLRDVRMGPDGYVYVAVEQPARIYRLVPVDEQN